MCYSTTYLKIRKEMISKTTMSISFVNYDYSALHCFVFKCSRGISFGDKTKEEEENNNSQNNPKGIASNIPFLCLVQSWLRPCLS